MRFEIFSYGGGDFLRLIFNGIAQIFGHNDYLVAIKITALIGFMGILLSSAFQKNKLDFRWIMGVILINMTLIVPKTHLIITDRVIPANSAIVQNVPFGISATATAFNYFGDWLTRSFETVFSLPNEIKYSQNGLLFAQTLVEESTHFEITTARVSSNLIDFWKSCAYYDIFLGLYTWDELLKATDLVDFLSRKTSKSRAFTYENGRGEREVILCREGFNNFLKGDIEREINSAMKVNGAKLISKSTENREFTERLNEAVGKFSTAMPIAYRYLTNLTLNNSQILSQNILANSFKRGLMNFATDADASAASEDFALAKAEAERRTTFSVMGKLAKKMLPILHNIFEAMIYAIFPIVMIMAMLSHASRVLLQYAKALFWVNLWPPLYAILHFAISYHSQKVASVAMVADGNGFLTGLTIMTNTELGNVLSDYSAITGYLSLSIPMISWLVINASGSMMASLAGRLMDGYEHPTSSASAEARSGNISMGQYNYQNQSAFQNSIAPQSTEGTMRIQGSDGVSENITSKGTYLTAPTSSFPMSIDTSKSFAEAHRNVASNLKSSEQSVMNETTNLQSSGLGQLSSIGSAINESKGLSESFSSADRYSLSNANDTAMRTYLDMAKKEGLDEKTAIDNAVQLGLNASGGLNAMVLKAGVGVNKSLGKSSGEVNSQSLNKSRHILQSEQFSQVVRDELVKSRDILARNNSDWAQSQSSSISNTINQMDQISMRRSEIAREMHQLSDLKEHSNQFTATINQKESDSFYNWLAEDKHIPKDQIINLYTNSNQGNFYARQEMSALATEFTESQIKNYISHNEGSNRNYNIVSPNKIDHDYQAQSKAFTANHKIDAISSWSDEGQYHKHIEQVKDHPSVTQDPSMLKEMDQAQKDFDQKKSTHDENHKDGPAIRYGKEIYKEMKEDLSNAFTKH